MTFVGSSAGSADRDRYGEALTSNGDLDGRPGDEFIITAKGYYSSLGGCSGGYFVVKNTTTTIRVNGPARTCFGSSVLVDDVDGDNEKEIVVGCGFNNRTSQVEIYDFDKATSKWVQSRTLNPNPSIDNMGIDTIRVPDLNNDGLADLAFAGNKHVQFWSARSFLPLGTFNFTPYGGRTQLAYVGDLDLDGSIDVLAANSGDSAPSFWGNVQCWSTKKWPFTPKENYVNATRGGIVDFDVDAGPAYGNQLYMMLGTLSGLGAPKKFGNAAGDFVLVPDALTFTLPNFLNYGPFVNWLGFLDANGKATVSPRWSSSNVSQFAPLNMHLQVLVIDYTKPDFSFLTNARHFYIR